MLVLFIYITKLASNEIFAPANKIHREVGRAKDLSAPLVAIEHAMLILHIVICGLLPSTRVFHIIS
jgi:hypothetical protein